MMMTLDVGDTARRLVAADWEFDWSMILYGMDLMNYLFSLPYSADFAFALSLSTGHSGLLDQLFSKTQK